MTDIAKAAQAVAALIDRLDDELEDGETIGDIFLISEVRAADEGASYMRWHCTTERFVVQVGMVAWANAALTNPQIRTTDDDGEEEDDG